MSSDEVAQDVSQVTDFHFHTCRKFRLFTQDDLKNSKNEARNRLATSSQLGVTIAVISSNQLTCFPTKSILDFKMTRENMNLEVTDLPMKSFSLSGVKDINDIGINSDGTLLAVLHTRNNDVSVDVFDIKKICSTMTMDPFKPLCSTRIGTEQVNQGTCLEWNPAFPDMFAAASTDRSILVAKIDPKNPSSQKLVGIGKLGAITTAISWSPKGKQLTVGDSLGKIVQLKPELDIVRSQFGPEHSPAYGKVTGLCWLATTEWLVSFERGSDHDAYLMRCKKDKPTEWIQYHELSYSSSKWPLPPILFPATALLVDWNVVIVGNTKTSEISTVGKREEWQTWVPVEGEGIYLPTTASGKDTVPIGVAVDRSMTAEVSLKPDGSQKHRPSPMVLCLTNDGVLTAHHVISNFGAHNSCQIASQNMMISGLQRSQFEGGSPLPAAPPAPRAQEPLAAKPSMIFEQKPPPPSTPLGIPKALPPPTVPQMIPQQILMTPTKPATSEATEDVKNLKTPEDTKAEQLAAKKKILVERYIQMNKEMTSSKDSIMKMGFAVGKVKATVLECAEVIKSSLGDSKEVMEELKNLILSIERMSERTQHTVKDMDFEIYEKMELVSNVEDGERIIDKLRSMSETEKLMRFNKLEATADLLSSKFDECNDKMRKLKANLTEKESLRKQAVLSPLRHNSNLNQLRTGVETEVALKVMRNVAKIILDTRERIQRTELDFVRFQRDAGATGAPPKNRNIQKPMEMSILEGDAPKRGNLSDAEIIKARQALVARIQKRGAVKTRNVHVESYRSSESREKKKNQDPMDTTSLSNAILKLSMTPRRVMQSQMTSEVSTPKSRMADATTQADEPPVVKTVVVTVESPAQPIQTAPVVSTPIQKPVTTTTMTTTPKVAPKKEEVKTPSTSIFSGSLFGSKTPQATPTLATGKSIFGTSSLTISPPEAVEAKVEEVKKVEPIKEESKTVEPIVEEPKDEPKVEPKVEAKVEEPKEEPKAVETKVEDIQKTPDAAPTTMTPEEPKKEESTPKTASFSFNSTPKSSSSIFGGGLQTTPGSSSIFGGATKTTPTPASTSIFGGGTKTSSPFGSFGQTPATTQATPSFSFNQAAPAKPSGFGAFGGGATKSSFGGGVAPSVPNVDDGMEDDSGVSGGFMSGLGAASGGSNSNSNPFAPKPATTSNSSWLFGGGATQQPQAQKPSFSFTNPSAPAAATPSTTTSSVFGGGPKFGSQPVFGGAKPFGSGTAPPAGGLSKNASIFGGATSSGGGGFAQFASGQKSSVFGGGAQQPANSSIFGGGAQTPAAPSSSIFGGGTSANANKSASFTSWR